MNYKPCCELTWFVGGCEVTAKGGCICVCEILSVLQLFDNLKNKKAIHWQAGFNSYFPTQEKFQERFDRLTEWQKKIHLDYVNNMDSQIKEAEEYLRLYELQ